MLTISIGGQDGLGACVVHLRFERFAISYPLRLFDLGPRASTTEEGDSAGISDSVSVQLALQRFGVHMELTQLGGSAGVGV